MPGIFITATGTEVGKTYVTAALIRAGHRAGLSIDALKPIMTGFDPDDADQSDAGMLLDALGLPITPEALATISPWRFAAPLAPNMAAAAEGARLDFENVVETCKRRLSPDRVTLIEGIGGIMVPLDETHTVLDLVVALAVPVLLVTGSYLGTLSHCLTAYEVLRSRGCPPALIALNESPHAGVGMIDTRDTLAAFCGSTPIVAIRRNADDLVEDVLLRSVLSALGFTPRGTRPSRADRTTA